MHIQAAYLKRNCLLEISCSLHISAFIKYDLTEETKWKSISCNSKLWLQCNGFIMSRMINTANRRLFQKQLPNRSLHLSSSSPLSSLCSPCPGGGQGTRVVVLEGGPFPVPWLPGSLGKTNSFLSLPSHPTQETGGLLDSSLLRRHAGGINAEEDYEVLCYCSNRPRKDLQDCEHLHYNATEILVLQSFSLAPLEEVWRDTATGSWNGAVCRGLITLRN